jgi:hypothetical protein
MGHTTRDNGTQPARLTSYVVPLLHLYTTIMLYLPISGLGISFRLASSRVLVFFQLGPELFSQLDPSA